MSLFKCFKKKSKSSTIEHSPATKQDTRSASNSRLASSDKVAEARGWGDGIHKLLRSTWGRAQYREYLKNENKKIPKCDFLIQCYAECLTYQRLSGGTAGRRIELASKILNTYVDPIEAVKQVDFLPETPTSVLLRLQQAVDSENPDQIDDAIKCVMNNISRQLESQYSAFLRSPKYAQCKSNG